MSCRSIIEIPKLQIIRIKRVFMLIVAALIGAQIVHSCLEEERVGLLHLKSYFKSHYHPLPGDETFEHKWFISGEQGYNCCAWERIQCNPYTSRVIGLYLDQLVNRNYESDNNTKLWLFNVTLFRPFNQLISLNLARNNINGLIEHDGSLTISTLSNLTSLALYGNPIRTNYVSFGALTSLTTLYLFGCELNQSIAASGICELRSLQNLDLSGNYFYNDVFLCLSNLTFLKILDLSSTHSNGKFPISLANLTLLEELYLYDNSFEDQLFLSSLSNLSMLQRLNLESSGLEIQTEDTLWAPTFQLQYLYLSDCNLNKPNGTFPTFLLHQYNLSEVDLSNNNLSGSLPAWLFTINSQLESLYLINNSFTGSLLLPNIIQPSLIHLDFSINRFNGKVPDNLGSIFPNLEYLNMSSNNFEGHIPSSIAKLGNLVFLDLSRNKFYGLLPRDLFTNTYLGILNVHDNRLQGDIIPEYMSLTQLQSLDASNNNFSNTINDSLLRSPELKYLDISNNNIMGHLPSWIGNLGGLQVLLASNNSLHGHISRGICKLKLYYLDLSRNNFKGDLPQCSNFSSLIGLYLNHNKLSGLITNSLSSGSSLREIDLRDNLFSGVLPSQIYKQTSLRVLQLGGNNLHSQIPQQICRLVNIEILDLSRNRLYGLLPTCFQNMSFGKREDSPYIAICPQSKADSFYNDGRIWFRGIALEYNRDLVQVIDKKQYYTYAGGDRLSMSALDLSCNNLSGVIPLEVGYLSHIKSINLSHNCLFGSIPSSFSNLEQVEGLDLLKNYIDSRHQQD